ncbi:MAG: hypothetical protein ACFFDF_12925 [Candidatus Odinarchaeota archaeon]
MKLSELLSLQEKNVFSDLWIIGDAILHDDYHEKKERIRISRRIHKIHDNLLEIFEKRIIKKEPSELRYKNISELRNKVCDLPKSIYNSKSSSEQLTMDLIVKLSPNYAWELYLGLHEFIDSFLF